MSANGVTNDPENPAYVSHFWDSIMWDMLWAYGTKKAEERDNRLQQALEQAVMCFMEYDEPENDWIRLHGDPGVDTTFRVDSFCGHVMAGLSMVPVECRAREDLEWVNKLHTIIELAQTMFQNIDKEVRVGIRRWDGRISTNQTTNPHIINAKHTIQEAVSQEYTAFPGVCMMIYVQRQTNAGMRQVIMFQRASVIPVHTQRDRDATSAFLIEDNYGKLRNGDVVRILVDDRYPGGPGQGDSAGPENLGPADFPWRLLPNNPRLPLGPTTLQEMRTCLHTMSDP
jgi:hypothetical protein